MSEDYTYPTTPTLADLRRTAREANQYALAMEQEAEAARQRVAELEAELQKAYLQTEAADARANQYLQLSGRQETELHRLTYLLYECNRERQAEMCVTVDYPVIGESIDVTPTLKNTMHLANQYLAERRRADTAEKALAEVPVKLLREVFHHRFGTTEVRWWPEWALPIHRWLFPEVQ